MSDHSAARGVSSFISYYLACPQIKKTSCEREHIVLSIY
uniref:Uncharacterized protein n=1 Tax=Anguilla anguilla TaxID=7936 RepID=A0A0E9TJT1_ANGAN